MRPARRRRRRRCRAHVNAAGPPRLPDWMKVRSPDQPKRVGGAAAPAPPPDRVPAPVRHRPQGAGARPAAAPVAASCLRRAAKALPGRVRRRTAPPACRSDARPRRARGGLARSAPARQAGESEARTARREYSAPHARGRYRGGRSAHRGGEEALVRRHAGRGRRYGTTSTSPRR